MTKKKDACPWLEQNDEIHWNCIQGKLEELKQMFEGQWVMGRADQDCYYRIPEAISWSTTPEYTMSTAPWSCVL